jgi:RHS repeat-associated protein
VNILPLTAQPQLRIKQPIEKIMKTLQKILFAIAALLFTAQAHAVMYQARPYDPNLARWISRDPIRENGGINLFAFVNNNPINKIDPAGKSSGTAGDEAAAAGIGASIDAGEGAADLVALNRAEAVVNEVENINALEGMAGDSDAVLNQFNNIEELIQEAGPFKTLRHGEQMGNIEGDLNAIFDKLAQGGKVINKAGSVELPDGTIITKYSGNSGATLQINTEDTIYKIRFP